MMNYEVLRDWSSDARRGLEREVERLKDKEEQESIPTSGCSSERESIWRHSCAR